MKEEHKTGIVACAISRERIAKSFWKSVTRLVTEIRTPRFVYASIVALVWLAVLCGFGIFIGHERQSALTKGELKPYELPAAQGATVIQRSGLGGTLEPAPGFNSYAFREKRYWFNLFLPASDVPDHELIRLENMRLMGQDGNLLCNPDVELELSMPRRVGIKADLDLTQQTDSLWRPTTTGYRLEVQWDQRFQECPYEQPASILADVVQRQSTPVESRRLELTDASRKLQADSSSITVQPGALTGEWWIEIANSGQQHWQFAGVDLPAYQGWSTKRYPLSPLRGVLLNRPTPNPIADIYQLRFKAEAPTELPVALLDSQEVRVADVRFSTEPDQRANASIPPTWHLPLLHTDMNSSWTLDLPMQNEDLEYQELFLPITMSHVCELRVVDADLPLQWRPVERLSATSYLRNGRLPEDHLGRVRWELRGSDGEQRFFHDVEVTSELRCPAEVSWQPLDYQPSELSWAVLLEVLPDDSVNPAQPAREFFGRFRFLDANGQALMPMARAAGLTEPTLESFAFSNGQLKFHGEVTRIEEVQIDDPSVHSQRWTYRFMPLEVY